MISHRHFKTSIYHSDSPTAHNGVGNLREEIMAINKLRRDELKSHQQQLNSSVVEQKIEETLYFWKNQRLKTLPKTAEKQLTILTQDLNDARYVQAQLQDRLNKSEENYKNNMFRNFRSSSNQTNQLGPRCIKFWSSTDSE